jgi:hypothetical protein
MKALRSVLSLASIAVSADTNAPPTLPLCDIHEMSAFVAPVFNGINMKMCLSDAGVNDWKSLYKAATPKQQENYLTSNACKSMYSDLTKGVANLTPCSMGEGGLSSQFFAAIPFEKSLEKTTPVPATNTSSTPSQIIGIVIPSLYIISGASPVTSALSFVIAAVVAMHS